MQLNLYVDEIIDDLIVEQCKNIIVENVVLIFDGYDEIEVKNLNIFVRCLNVYVKKYLEQIIVILIRNNFYKNVLDKINVGIFNDFKEYVLCLIEEIDIKEFLKNKEIDLVFFFEEV